jgi:hypothetical protein
VSAEFFAVQEQDRSRLDRATKTTYVNLDAILYVDDYGVRGEPMRVSCVGKETYWLVNDDAERLVAKLKERCKS